VPSPLLRRTYVEHLRCLTPSTDRFGEVLFRHDTSLPPASSINSLRTPVLCCPKNLALSPGISFSVYGTVFDHIFLCSVRRYILFHRCTCVIRTVRLRACQCAYCFIIVVVNVDQCVLLFLVDLLLYVLYY
jgi:hypothetical protein